MRGTGIALALALCGCATSAAQRAFDDGDYGAAATRADEAARANPGDADARALRDRARDREAETQLAQVASFRSSGHGDAALGILDRLLKELAAWGGADALSPPRRAAFEDELRAMGEVVKAIGAASLSAGHPLAAEAEAHRLNPVLTHAELASARADLLARIKGAGQDVCQRMQQTVSPEMAQWGLALSRYCAHFEVTFAPPAPTRAPSAFALEGTVTGLTADQAASFRERVQSWLKASLWYDSRGAATARGKLAGRIETSFQHQTVTLHAPYEDTITSHANEGSLAVGDIPNPITQLLVPQTTSTTNMDRVFTYDAEESRGHYGLDAKVSFDLGAPQPVAFELRHVDNIKAYDHDVTFEKAGISPTHDHLPSSATWLESQLDRMSTRVVATLNRRYAALYCAQPAYSLDDAARCLMAGQKPAAAWKLMDDALGGEAERALPILRPPPPALAATKPARAKPPRPAQTRPQDAEDPVID